MFLYIEGKMRNPDRIDRVLKLISEIWHEYPDLRLCQLIGNCFPDHVDEYYIPNLDIYYIEDDELEERLRDTYL